MDETIQFPNRPLSWELPGYPGRSARARIKVDQLPAALRGSVLFTRLLSIESGNIHYYRAVRQHTDLIISIRLACLSAACTRGTRLAAPFRVISQTFFSLVLQVEVTARHPLVVPPWPSPQQGSGGCEQMPHTSAAAGTHKTGMGGTSRNVNAPALTRG